MVAMYKVYASRRLKALYTMIRSIVQVLCCMEIQQSECNFQTLATFVRDPWVIKTDLNVVFGL